MNFIQRFTYKSWTILIMPHAQNWHFSCCPPGEEPLTSDRAFPSDLLALSSAKLFVDCNIIRLQLANLLDELLETQQIDRNQYDRASKLIADLIKLKTSECPVFVPTPHQQPAESPPETSP